MLDSSAAIYDPARDRVNWNRPALSIVDDEQILSSGARALDYLGIDPDRDRHPLHHAPRSACRIQALETGRAQASWMGATFSAPLKKKGYTLLVDLSNKAQHAWQDCNNCEGLTRKLYLTYVL